MRKTGELVLGAMCAVLVVLITFLNLSLAGYFQMFIPMPLMYYGSVASFRNVCVTYISSVLLVFLTFGFGYAALVFGYGLIGVVYTAIKNKNAPKYMRYIGASLANSVNFLIMMTFFSAILGVDFQQDAQTVIQWIGVQSPAVVSSIVMALIFGTAIMEACVAVYFYETFEPLLNRIRK